MYNFRSIIFLLINWLYFRKLCSNKIKERVKKEWFNNHWMVIKWLSHVFLSEKLKLQNNMHCTMPLLFKMYMLLYISIYIHIQIWELDNKKGWVSKNDAFELWCWIRLLRVSWTARRSNQSILKEINPEHSLEGLMLKLKLQYFGHLMQRADSLEKTLMLGKTEGRKRRGDRGWDGWMVSSTQ